MYAMTINVRTLLITAAVAMLLALGGTGIAFLMITLALGQTLWGVAYRWADVTGGDNGIAGIRRPELFGLDLNDPETRFSVALGLRLEAIGGSAFGASGESEETRSVSSSVSQEAGETRPG